MVQSLNTKALVTLASVIRRPSLLVPHVSVDNISEINYAAMKERAGIRAVVFDKDNTLTAPYAMEIHPLAAFGLEAAKRIFGAENVAIMSNSAGTLDDPGYVDAQQIETTLGIAVIRHDEKKPGGLEEVLSHFQMDDPAALCMVGDRLLTDVVFGNLYGMLTIHTLPLCRGADNQSDNMPAKVIRSVENKGLYGNWFGGRMLQRNKPDHKYWPGEMACSLRIPDQTMSSSAAADKDPDGPSQN
jgi:phosphatidylglycerophosphatase GEP4